MIDDLQACYRLFDVEPGVPLEEVKRAYRELVRVWHPDRFAHDPALQQRAQEKLKQINLAYEQICNRGVDEPFGRTASAETNSNDAKEYARSSGSDASSNSDADEKDAAPHQTSQTNWGRRFAQFAVTVVVITILKAAFSTNEDARSRNITYSAPYPQPTPTDQVSQSPATRIKQQTENASGLVKDNEAESPVTKTPEPDSSVARTTGGDFFTVGSTQDEVLAVQGTPQKFTESEFGYDYSTVYFAGGRVSSWSDISKNLKVKMTKPSD